jgi:peptide/nickel transport system substrate-binding protein
VIPDAASRSVALEQGHVQLTQWTDIEAFDVARLSKLPNYEMSTKGYEFFAPHQFLELNNRVKPMDDKRFRQAVMYAIDRKALLQRIYFGIGKLASGPVSSKTRFHEKNVKEYEYSVDKAKALLDEMGLKPGADGKRVTLKYLVPPYGESYQRTGEFVRQNLARVGIDIQLENTDIAGWAEKCSNWDFHMTMNLVYQFGDPALGVARTYITSNIRKGVLFSNTAGYSNPEVDKLFDEAAVATSDAKRQELYSAVQKLLVEEMPVCWMFEAEYPNFIDKRLKNVLTTGIGVHETFGAVSYG